VSVVVGDLSLWMMNIFYKSSINPVKRHFRKNACNRMKSVRAHAGIAVPWHVCARVTEYTIFAFTRIFNVKFDACRCKLKLACICMCFSIKSLHDHACSFMHLHASQSKLYSRLHAVFMYIGDNSRINLTCMSSQEAD
jgi:hypothetical protein